MSEELKRIAIDNLSVEITRRCQLKCAHCMRGDAQNVDISTEVIDKLLESVVSIGTLLFTGGEPTMNLDGMQYFLNVMKDKGISLHTLRLVTNGCDVSEDVINLLKEYYEYIDYDKQYGANKIMISISDDVYHRGSGSNPEEAFQKYIKAFENCPHIYITKYSVGNVPKKTGRAKQLEESVVNLFEYLPLQKIEVMTVDSHNYCVCRKYYELEDNVDAVIMCPFILSVYGGVAFATATEIDRGRYDKIGVSIMGEGLLNAIHQYNQKSEYCIACQMIKDAVVKTKYFLDIGSTSEIENTVDRDEFIQLNRIIKEQGEYPVSEDEKKEIIAEWREAVGEKVISNINRTTIEIMGKIDPRYHKMQEISRIASKIVSDIMPTYNTAYYVKKESFKNDAELHIREEHPDWEHVDCIRYANSQKWVDYYSEQGKHPNMLLYMKHIMTIQSIIDKYK